MRSSNSFQNANIAQPFWCKMRILCLRVCGGLRDAQRTCRFMIVPDILIMTLNRIQTTSSQRRQLKRPDHVLFPLTNLSLKPFLHPANSQFLDLPYHLSAVIVHDGLGKSREYLVCCYHHDHPQTIINPWPRASPITAAQRGHYRCLGLHHKKKKWFEFNDALVKAVTANQVQQSTAYILIYER